ncbi:hypothetical protein [Puniceibacterium sp. IMCC21224]|uniref:hypothetical protein n=1 Tax=Puniceibacterium sp. IMCC21224 TaxID=1618204 RepID=UPI00065D5011|nr:hypothetical protein [Puniceibacterium sp. IMCC21224]KMK64559.1 hypothetical protein IMCC21224_1394 [Puniceibacterium sp. IMCC21224]
MRFEFKNIPLAAFLALALTGPTVPTQARAQTYQIDCAILLCLSGGWPASVPCARARAEFIRRITPWPVEPPLQIWRCPMGASYDGPVRSRPADRIFYALYGSAGTPPNSAAPLFGQAARAGGMPVFKGADAAWGNLVKADYALQLVEDRADIDISGQEFNFVRSIRVFDVRYAWQRKSGDDGDCNRSAVVVLGTYGTQGDFSWRASTPAALPAAHAGLKRWGERCPSIFHRSVFVEWRDYNGNYGFEQVNY